SFTRRTTRAGRSRPSAQIRFAPSRRHVSPAGAQCPQRDPDNRSRPQTRRERRLWRTNWFHGHVAHAHLCRPSRPLTPRRTLESLESLFEVEATVCLISLLG